MASSALLKHFLCWGFLLSFANYIAASCESSDDVAENSGKFLSRQIQVRQQAGVSSPMKPSFKPVADAQALSFPPTLRSRIGITSAVTKNNEVYRTRHIPAAYISLMQENSLPGLRREICLGRFAGVCARDRRLSTTSSVLRTEGHVGAATR